MPWTSSNGKQIVDSGSFIPLDLNHSTLGVAGLGEFTVRFVKDDSGTAKLHLNAGTFVFTNMAENPLGNYVHMQFNGPAEHHYNIQFFVTGGAGRPLVNFTLYKL